MLHYPPELLPKIQWLESRATPSFTDTLGFVLTHLYHERVEGVIAIQPSLHQPFGLMHGGISAVIVESVASIGAWLNVSETESVVGLEVNVNHLAAVKEGQVRASGFPVHRGRSTQVWIVDLFKEETRVATGRCTLLIKRELSLEKVVG